MLGWDGLAGLAWGGRGEDESSRGWLRWRRGRGQRTLDFYGEQSESSDERKTHAKDSRGSPTTSRRREFVEHGIVTNSGLSIGFCQRAPVELLN
jgi:hypothetical protein